jgi:hypothetical protein
MDRDDSITLLRMRFRDARLHRLGEQVMCYMRLLRHRDLCWLDLLEALSYPGMISDDAALVLGRRLGEPCQGAVKDRNHWESLIIGRGLALDSSCALYLPRGQRAPKRPVGVGGDALDLDDTTEGPAAA